MTSLTNSPKQTKPYPQACDLLEGLIPVKQDPNSGREEIAVLSAEHLGRLYVFALMWSLGALLELEDRVRMQEFMVDRCSVDLPLFNKFPDGTTIFEFVVDDKGGWWGTSELFYTELSCK